jgi:hypothetical protein
MRIFTVLAFLVFISGKLLAQNDEAAVAAADAPPYPVTLYKSATILTQNLYNGRQYYLYDAREEEFQFYNQRKWHNGVVMYDGQRFDSIPMLYDIFKDELVIKHFMGDHLLLQSEKVSYFILDQHHFARLEAGKEIDPQMRTGFYDIVYNGKSRMIVRRTKSRQEKIIEKRVTALYLAKNFYYVFKDDRFHGVQSKKAVYNLFPEHKKELRKVLRDEKIRFRKNRELAIARMVAKHDELARL